METRRPLPAELKRWAHLLQERGLASIAVPVLDVLQLWGFVGGQLLWMLEPFGAKGRFASLAEALEQPETLQLLRQYLAEGDPKP